MIGGATGRGLFMSRLDRGGIRICDSRIVGSDPGKLLVLQRIVVEKWVKKVLECTFWG